jgi:cobalt/nickel transport system permease protein
MRPLRRSPFIERTLLKALAVLGGSVYAEGVAAQPGLLQGLDPRFKAISLAGLIIALLFLKSLPALGLAYALALGMALASRISLPAFIARTWLFIPVFSLAIALPALFSTPGPALLRWGPLAVSKTGLMSAACFVLRVAAAVSFSVLLALTTRHTELLRALRCFGLPPLFVMVLGMAYRYIYLMVEVLEQTFRAIKSRVGSAVEARPGQGLVAWSMASLWARSYRLNDQVYMAMLSRGYRGEPAPLRGFRARARDWAFLGFSALAVALLIRSFPEAQP